MNIYSYNKPVVTKMARKRKPRQIGFIPEVTYFKPQGIPLSLTRMACLTIDELEAVRLVDLKQLEQIEAAQKMNISQPTLQRILKTAHKKIAGALVEGKAIKVEGGEVMMPRFGRGAGPGGGRGRGRGWRPAGTGRGRMGGPFAAGPLGECACTNPDCKKTIPHQAGAPCYQVKCPKCGSPMIRKA